MHESLTNRQQILLFVPLVLALPLVGCGCMPGLLQRSSPRAVRIEVIEKGNGPVQDVTISVLRGSLRRDPLEVTFETDDQGSVLVDSLAKESVEILVVANDPKYSSQTVPVPPGFNETKSLRVELELTPTAPADTTRQRNTQDPRVFRK